MAITRDCLSRDSSSILDEVAKLLIGGNAPMKLQSGKRYSWPVTMPFDGRVKSGLFTGQYAKNGNAILICKNGEKWSVPEKDCILSKAFSYQYEGRKK